MKFNRVGVQVKKVADLRLTVNAKGIKTISCGVPDKEYARLKELLDKGHKLVTVAIWVSPDLHPVDDDDC